MSKKNVETITLEPITSIISFDAISFRTYIAVSGAIGHYKYPIEEEYRANKKAFFNSGVGRRNKQKLTEVVSEIYAFLNTKISEHADPADYYFRLSLKLEVNKDTAEIVGTPSFDIDVFRHIGKIGGKHAKIGHMTNIILIDKDKVSLSPIFRKGISKVKQETGLIEFTIYESYSKAPSDIKEKISNIAYFLIIDEESLKIEPDIDPMTHDVIYKIAESSGTTEFRSEEDVARYVLKKLKINPKIIGSETGLTFVDKEISNISRDLEETEVEPRTDLIAQLGIEQTLSELLNKLDSFKARANSEKAKYKERNKANIQEIKNEFDSLKVDLEVQQAELDKLEEDHTKNEIKEDDYRTYRVRRLKAIAIIKTKLIDLQKTLKEKCASDINSLIKTKNNGAK